MNCPAPQFQVLAASDRQVVIGFELHQAVAMGDAVFLGLELAVAVDRHHAQAEPAPPG